MLHALSIRVLIALCFFMDVLIANVCGLESQLNPHDVGLACLPDPSNVGQTCLSDSYNMGLAYLLDSRRLGLALAKSKGCELGFKVY